MLHMLRVVRSTLDKSAPPAWRRCPEQAAPGCRMSSLPPCFWGCGCVPPLAASKLIPSAVPISAGIVRQSSGTSQPIFGGLPHAQTRTQPD